MSLTEKTAEAAVAWDALEETRYLLDEGNLIAARAFIGAVLPTRSHESFRTQELVFAAQRWYAAVQAADFERVMETDAALRKAARALWGEQ